jgi:hypothetical protein
MTSPTPLISNRIRKIESPFAWIPCRLLINGSLQNMSDPAKLLYTFLCLAADRQGISFYGDKRILSHFQITPDLFNLARIELIQKDLIAYDGKYYQVLSLPIAKPAAYPKPQNSQNKEEPERFSDILARIANAQR